MLPDKCYPESLSRTVASFFQCLDRLQHLEPTSKIIIYKNLDKQQFPQDLLQSCEDYLLSILDHHTQFLYGIWES